MLSIKHVERGGTEHIIQAVRVSKQEGGVEVFGCEEAPAYRFIGNGTVYVMNDKGSTVGVYDMLGVEGR